MSCRQVVAVVLVVLLAGVFSGTPARAKKREEPNYTLGYGDVIDVLVWKEADFTVEGLTVRLDGKITLPLVNDIRAEGQTTRQLKAHLEIVLRKYIESPVVTVLLKEARSQRFYILGEVMQTGEYSLTKELTVLQAFAIAGGFTEWAKKKDIFVLRRKETGEAVIPVNYLDIISGKDLKGNIVIRADDTIVVP
ncbi:polysaccharide biosynthesis/export family protein [Desulfoluna spongiiphila]|uniref:Polysaccharide export outer membrane protein n=1 Tax=Desulfoluna spongiiphila TaxID=419481 RepID=A0A1G5BY67_9BACT|nr:polysaccharide biosynthesis/export family protein [Desulfoluna spongiiphila]SCX95071.1 polysaccharide export outer membrane protein [Desulfoluna spongiiphila]